MADREDDLISVIVPTWNGAGFLPAAVDSLLCQTYPRVEVIVINDGSPDDTDRVMEAYRDRVVYRVQENQGTAAARNHGLRIARGRWGALLDHDDVSTPDRLERQLKALRERPEAIACFAGHWLFEGDRRIKDYPGQPIREREDALAHFCNYFVWGPTMLFDRSRAEDLWFADDVRRVDDQVFVCLLRLRGEFVILPDLLYGSREWTGQVSKQGGRDALGGGLFPRLEWLQKHGREHWPDKSFEELEEALWRGVARQVANHYWTRHHAYFREERKFVLEHWPRRLPLPAEVHWRWYPDWLWQLKDKWDRMWKRG